jgi:hypothetical protein
VLSLRNLFVTWGGLFRLITSLFSPVINDYDFNLFSSPFDEGAIRTYALFSYSFILCPLILPQLFARTDEALKPIKRVLLVLSVCSLIPLFYYLFNGNQASRWCFYFIVFHVMTIAYLIEHRDTLDKVLLKRSLYMCLVLLGGFTLAALWFHTYGSRRALLMIVPCLCVLLAGYTVSLLKNYCII